MYRATVRTARWTRPAYLGRYYMGTQAVLVQHSAAALVAAHIRDTQATSPDLRAYSRRSDEEDAGEHARIEREESHLTCTARC